jgi:hypothetical protein
MDLIFKYINRGIEGYTDDELKRILFSEHVVTVKNVANSVMLLSNDRIIKCAAEYYASETGVIVKRKKVTNECFFIQKTLGIKSVANYDCKTCHMECLRMKRENKLIKI